MHCIYNADQKYESGSWFVGCCFVQVMSNFTHIPTDNFTAIEVSLKNIGQYIKWIH